MCKVVDSNPKVMDRKLKVADRSCELTDSSEKASKILMLQSNKNGEG